MSSEKFNPAFLPVSGPNELIAAQKPLGGELYFTTDTQKIYLGTSDGKKLLMGYDTGIFYGEKEIPKNLTGTPADPNVSFYLNEISGDRLPLVGDLVLNIDGCFYKVTDVIDEYSVMTKRLTLQGTGSGGGGGTGDNPSSADNFTVSIKDGVYDHVFSSATDHMYVEFMGNYRGTDDNCITQVTFSIKRNGVVEDEPFYAVTNDYSFNNWHRIDLINYIDLFNQNRTTVVMTAYDKYGLPRTPQKDLTIRIVELSISKTMDNLIYTESKDYTYACQVSGATQGISKKWRVYNFYEEKKPDVSVLEIIEEDMDVSDEGNLTAGLNLTGLSHGNYIMTVQAFAKIANSTVNVESNILTHKLCYFDPNVGSPCLMIMLPEKTEQYTNIPVEYLLLTSDRDKEYTLVIEVAGKEPQKYTILSKNRGSENLYFEEEGTFITRFIISELPMASFTTELVIQPYTGNLPVINPGDKDLMLYLNPKGKSNNAYDRAEWRDYNGVATAKLTDLHYGEVNGWLMEEDGTSYLKLSSGAKMEVPRSEFRPFKEDPTTTSATNSRMGYGMTIELDFAIEGILDYDAEIISCLSKSKTGSVQCGFNVVGDKIKVYNNRLNGDSYIDDEGKLKYRGYLSSQTLVEGKRVRLSFVIEPRSVKFPMCHCYVDGKSSGSVIYDEKDDFKDVADNPAYLKIDSTSAQVKIYGIRFYSTALTNRVILNNYTASFASIDDRQDTYDSNNVFDAQGKKISYDAVMSEEYERDIPVMILTGGWKTQGEPKGGDKWRLLPQANKNVGLPQGKKDYRLVDVEVIYPDPKTHPFFEGYSNYKFVNTFADGKTMANAYNERPTNGGVIMYAQGTSSMEYPIKNLRLRFKEDSDFFTVKPSVDPVEIICMKADYMESSGSHNTGTANLVDDLYSNINIQTPGQERFDPNKTGSIVTCIKGHPCLIFYSTGEPGAKYEFIGKYNLNLDKATPEPFGFDHDNSDFGYLKPGDKYYEIDYDDDDNYIDTLEGEEEKEVQEGDKINSIHCFEFLDNGVKVCNFLPHADAEDKGQGLYHNTWYGTYENKDGDLAPGWTLGFESRYPEDKVGYHDADSLWPLASWLNELYNIKTGKEGQTANPEKALARFRNEYECYLDKEFLLSYYLITEALLMIDSRVKNMMIATWGKQARSYVDYETGETVPTNNYIFYPIFYDMDSMLGLDNTGVARFNYYDEDTATGIYNGDQAQVLWSFVRDALSNELASFYDTLEGGGLEASSILPYYNRNQANMANEAFYNGDAYYKYIDPAREGYYDGYNKKDILPGEAPYLYASQGDRSLMRESFLTNRIKFLRGKYKSSKFKSSDRIVYRQYCPTENDSDPLLALSVRSLKEANNGEDLNGIFEFTSLKTGYAGIQLGANAPARAERFNGEEKKQIEIDTTSANGTEAYLLGLSTLSDLGDLSTKYMQKFIMEPAAGEDIQLKKLKLGHAHKNYYNKYWNTTVDGQSAKISLGGCKYLQEFNLQNCGSYNNTIDFSACSAIETILLTGSGVTGVTLPVNGTISELRLPTSITNLEIRNHSGLNDNGFSLGGYVYGPSNMIAGDSEGHYTNDFSGIIKVYVTGTPINTYNIVKDAIDLDSYYLHDINWTISAVDPDQYCLRTEDFFYDEETKTTVIPANKYYYYDITTQEYKLYAQTSYPTEGSLYEKATMLDENDNIVCIPILEYLLSKTPNQCLSHAEALQGKITIKVPNTSVVELDIYKKYSEVYPDLTIEYDESVVNVEGAYKINFYEVDKDTLEAEGTPLEDVNPYFTQLTAADSYTLAQLVQSQQFRVPGKASTNTNIFTFKGVWIDWNTKTEYYQDEYYTGTSVPGKMFSTVKPTQDMNLVPIFDSDVRLYSVTLYDYDGSELVTENLPFNADIGTTMRSTYVYYNYRPHSDNSKRYEFDGWQSNYDYKNAPNIVTYETLEGRMVTNEVAFYAHYKEEDRSQPSNSKYFATTNKTMEVTVGDVKESFTGALIRLADKYQGIFEGPITLPLIFNNKEVVGIDTNGFKKCKVTEVLFDPNGVNHYIYIGSNAFFHSIYLERIDIPNTLLYIDDQAFAPDTNSNITPALAHTNLENSAALVMVGRAAFNRCANLVMPKLPDTLRQIGGSAFFMTGLAATALPRDVEYIDTWAFASSKVVINTIGAENSSTAITIKADAFNSTSPGANITIYPPVDNIENGAFDSFGKGFMSVTIPVDVTDEQLSAWQLPIAANATISRTL